MAFIGEYLTTGMPLITKTITVDGSAIKEPKNVIAPIGTQITEQASVSSATRRNVTMPNTNACPSSPNPASR